MEKLLFIAQCENGSYDVLENINGHDKGNYNYCSIEAVLRDYNESEWEYVFMEDLD